MLHLFSFFHLNLAFSSIEEELRPEVIRQCYWPILRLAGEQKIPLGIEASGYTLEEIYRRDPEWIAELRKLCGAGHIEFIGSGYAQLIGPLAPAAVNRANQRIGLSTYQDILQFRPRIVLVSEQAYAAGLIPIYREAGYEAIIMEWDNASSSHQDWKPEWRYLPQKAIGTDGAMLPVIWNKSIPFQKFQRYAHAEMEMPDYIDFVNSHVGTSERTFSLYGNDAEIFNFRPGRFSTEAAKNAMDEWERIARFYRTLRDQKHFSFIQPSSVLGFLDHPGAGNPLHLESTAQPVVVKKQAKYNIMRWALSGRDDLWLNTACWRIFDSLSKQAMPDDAAWKELCYLWSSDFRTHITEKRWQKVKTRLDDLQKRLEGDSPKKITVAGPPEPDEFKVEEKGAFLEIETSRQRLRLCSRRGLAIDGWWDKSLGEKPLIGTLSHGYYDNIQFGADFYSGHFVLEIPGHHKITDLSNVIPKWEIQNGRLIVKATIQTSLGRVGKEIHLDSDRSGFEILYHFHWPSCPNGSLRLGHITLNPELFDESSLFFQTHNGGDSPETFHLENTPVNHLAPISSLVSISHGVGLTSGLCKIGDARRCLAIGIDKCLAALTGHVVYAPVDSRYFYRLVLSAMEMDDTSCKTKARTCFDDRIVRISVKTG